VPDPSHRSRSRFHAHPEGRTVLTSARDGAGQVIDVPLVSRPAEERSSSMQSRLGSRVHRTGCRVLLRKEVIQPHLPVRLPCYDFVPIASPTFDGSLHKGWATGFGCCRLS
jgi:hypothetical protein